MDITDRVHGILCNSQVAQKISKKPNSSSENIKPIIHKDFPGIFLHSEVACQFSGNEKGLYEALSDVKKDINTSLYVYVFPGAELALSQFILKLDITKGTSTIVQYALFDGDTGKLMLLDPGIQDL